jgi:hypothetical protein
LGTVAWPHEIVDRLNAEVVKILHASDLQARFAREAIDTKSMGVDAFTGYFKIEAALWTPLARSVFEQVKAGGR